MKLAWIQGGSEACDQVVLLYYAGANGATNDGDGLISLILKDLAE